MTHAAGVARERFVGTQEAARRLGIHRSTLFLAVQRRVVVPDHVTPGGHYRFSETTLAKFREHMAREGVTSDEMAFAPMRTLAEIARDILPDADPHAACATALDGIAEALDGAEMCLVALRPTHATDCYTLRTAASRNFPEWMVAEYARHRHEGRVQYATKVVLRTGAPQVCEDTHTDPTYNGTASATRRAGIRAFAVFPIRCEEAATGVLVVASTHPHRFIERELTFLQGVADELGALLRTRMYAASLASAAEMARELTTRALELHACVTQDAAHGRDEARISATLAGAFRRGTGALDVRAYGFVPETHSPRDDSADNMLRALAERATRTEADEAAVEHWADADGITTGLAVRVVLPSGGFGAIAARYPGRRTPSEVDRSLLLTFGATYALALGLS